MFPPFVLDKSEALLICILTVPPFSKCHTGGIKEERVKNMKVPYLHQLHVV
jgi:hypothetical protein